MFNKTYLQVFIPIALIFTLRYFGDSYPLNIRATNSLIDWIVMVIETVLALTSIYFFPSLRKEAIKRAPVGQQEKLKDSNFFPIWLIVLIPHVAIISGVVVLYGGMLVWSIPKIIFKFFVAPILVAGMMMWRKRVVAQ